jgi:CelD/BcsL family acetyltransferase involved in cellulose biosynthesis
MRVQVISVAELSADLRRTWAGIQRRNRLLASPYFSPEYILAAGACRAGVRIGVIEEASRPLGFFPFEIGRFGSGRPVGGRLSDYHGVIAPPGAAWRPADLVAGCGLRQWRFDHLPVECREFAPFVEAAASSWVLDLSGGFEHYRQQRRRAGSKRIDRILCKSRKLRREHGEVQFEFDSVDPVVLDQVIQWKREQCQRTGVVDFLAETGNAGLIRRIHATRTAEFAGVLSVLRVRGRIAAAHFGMRSPDTLHYWLPAYDRQLAHYSPGAILLLDVAREAAARGLVRLDLGKGDDAYKSSFCTHATEVAEGMVVVSQWRAVVRRWRRATVRFLRTAPVAAPLRVPVRALRRLRARRVGLAPLIHTGTERQ